MENLKIRVMTEQESKEAQELFFELGARWGNGSNIVIDTVLDFPLVVCVGDGRLYLSTNIYEDKKEITLPQLRDKVVLHRNDVRDATHDGDNRKGYLSSESVEYCFVDDVRWHKLEYNTFKSFGMVEINKSKSEVSVENLISGKEALIALANGEDVQGNIGSEWVDISVDQKLSIKSFITETNDYGGAVKFRLKPRTIKIGDVEVPAPFDAKPSDGGVFYLNDMFPCGYDFMQLDESDDTFTMGAWRTESEIKQVVVALRKLMGVAK